MANRFPLIFNSGAGQIQELAASDNLDLTSSNLVNAGILFTSSGSQTAPSISIGNGTTYPPGLYSPGTDQLAVATNGTGRLFVDASGNITIPSNGNLGINGASPQSPLDVISNASSYGISLRGRSGDSLAQFRFTSNDHGTIYAALETAPTYLAAHVNGSERLRITSTGTLNFKGAGTAGSTQAVSFDGSAPINSLVIDSSGRLGIGTGSPAVNLQVNAASDVGIALSNSSSVTSGNRGSISMLNSAVSNVGLIRFAAVTDNVGTEIQFFTRPAAGSLTQTMTLDSSGRLGIGTAGPTKALEVAAGGTVGGGVLVTGSSSPQILLTAGGSVSVSIQADGSAGYFGTSTNHPLNFRTNNQDRAQIDTSGRLLIGTTSNANGGQVEAKTALVVSGNPAYDKKAFIAQIPYATTNITSSLLAGFDGNIHGVDLGYRYNGTGYDLCFATNITTSGSPTERMRITSGSANGANFLFNCTSFPSTSVKGIGIAPNGTGGNFIGCGTSNAASYNHFEFYNPNGTVGTISTNASATAYNTSSDYRLKENVAAVTDGIARLQQLKPSRFNFIADPDRVVDGFIAHEVQAIVPEAITGEKDAVDDDGNPKYQGIDQSKLVPLLTAALQEAIAKIESLEARLTAAGI